MAARRDQVVDTKATYRRSMDVPEGALLTVENLSVELVSFPVHSKHMPQTNTLIRPQFQQLSYIANIITVS